MSKRRAEQKRAKAARKESWKSMSAEAKVKWNEERLRTAQTGYAKRQRERLNGVPMASRSHESPPRNTRSAVRSRPPPEVRAWLEDFHRRTAA